MEAGEAKAPGEDSGASPVVRTGQAASRRSRRGRATLLISTAAVLGLVAGTCAGYLVQADRPPTKLPSLAQPLSRPAAGQTSKPLPAAQDRRVRTNGDLRKLLVKKPQGAREAEWVADADGWMDLAAYAEKYAKSGQKFSQYIHDEFRRAAVASWTVDGSHTVEVYLVQFHQEEALAAVEAGDNGRHWASWMADAKISAIPGTGDGETFVHNQPKPGRAHGRQAYVAEAYAWRGDIEMEILITGSKRISEKLIADLAKRQMERL